MTSHLVSQTSRGKRVHALSLAISPQTSHLRPRTSDLRLHTSILTLPTSHLKPQTSHLGPQTSDLPLQTSDITPQTSHQNTSHLTPPPIARKTHPPVLIPNSLFLSQGERREGPGRAQGRPRHSPGRAQGRPRESPGRGPAGPMACGEGGFFKR